MKFRGALDYTMRLFLDANIMTYVAIFEGFLVEGTSEEIREATRRWISFQGSSPDPDLRRQIAALRLLYLFDDRGHFDWLFSDIALAEINAIPDAAKRNVHRGLLTRLIEHRTDVYDPMDDLPDERTILDRVEYLFPDLPGKMTRDACQYCEAEAVEAYYFVTNDQRFRQKVRTSAGTICAVKPSEIPFLPLGELADLEGLWEPDWTT